jgi:hypothetical protein
MDIYMEPTDVDPETLRNLGPLREIAGNLRSAAGIDVNPKAASPRPSPSRKRGRALDHG